jgi:hypothetical protein
MYVDAQAVSGSARVWIRCNQAVTNSCDNLTTQIGTPDEDRSNLLTGLATTSTWTQVSVVSNWVAGAGFKWAVSTNLPEVFPDESAADIDWPTQDEPFACGTNSMYNWEVVDRGYAQVVYWEILGGGYAYDVFNGDYLPSGTNWTTEVGLPSFRGIEYSPDGFSVIEWDFSEP